MPGIEGILLLAGCWLVFTASVLRARRISAASRLLILTANNGVFFALAAWGIPLPLLWFPPLALGSLILILSVVASRMHPEERALDFGLFVQGMALTALGLANCLIGLQFAATLAAQSFVLLYCSERHRKLRQACLLALFLCWIVLKVTAGNLMSAARHNDGKRMAMCVWLGADANEVEKTGWYHENKGRTTLTGALGWTFNAVNPSTIAYLIKAGADVNLRDGLGEPPVCVAARRGDVEIIRVLANAGADFGQMYEKESPLEIARRRGQQAAALEIEKILAAQNKAP